MKQLYSSFLFLVSLLGVFSPKLVAADDKKSVPAGSTSKRLEFDEHAIQALNPGYGKLDLTRLTDANARTGKLSKVRKDFRREQSDSVKNWGASE